MSKRKGRKYERELLAILEKYGIHVVDVASNAGATGRFDADLLIWPLGKDPAENWHLREDGHMVEVEVKYRSDTAYFGKIYTAHLASVGLGTTDCVEWSDGYRSGGLFAFINSMGGGTFRSVRLWQQDEPVLNGFIDAAFKPGVTVVACRMVRSPWVFIWKIDDDHDTDLFIELSEQNWRSAEAAVGGVA